MARNRLYNRNGSFSDYGAKLSKKTEKALNKVIEKGAQTLTPVELRVLESLLHRSVSWLITCAILRKQARMREKRRARR